MKKRRKMDDLKKIRKILEILSEAYFKDYRSRTVSFGNLLDKTQISVQDFYIFKDFLLSKDMILIKSFEDANIKSIKDSVNFKDRVGIKISGLDYLERLKDKERNEKQIKINVSMKRSQWMNIILLFFLVVTTFYIGCQSNKISSRQTQILEKTAIPNKAELSFNPVRLRGDYLPSYHFNELDLEKQIEILIMNKGGIDSGIINIFGLNMPGFLEHRGYSENKDYISNIESGGTDRIEIYFRKKGSYFFKSEKENDTIEPGIYYLVLEYSCDFCEPVLNQELIPICVYKFTSSECKYSSK